MRDYELSADQVRNQAGCTFIEAQAAVYMASGALSGWSMAELEKKIGIGHRACRDWAFRWGIQFPDYDPFEKPRRIDWRKANKGWELLEGDAVIGFCRLTEERGTYGNQYEAVSGNHFSRRWSADDAMRDVSALLDSESERPLRAVKTGKNELVDCIIFPVEDEEVNRCRDALQYRCKRKFAA